MMNSMRSQILLLLIIAGVSHIRGEIRVINYDYKIHNHTLISNNVVLCTKRDFEENAGSRYYMVGFVPHRNHLVEHHLSLWACRDPDAGAPQIAAPHVWQCAAKAPPQPNFALLSPCLSGTGHQFFAFNNLRQGPFILPPGVGIQIGNGTGFDSVILASHYTDVLKTGGWTGETGVTVQVAQVMKDDPALIRAGILVTYLWGLVPAKSDGAVIANFPIEEDVSIHPYSLSFHAHQASRRGIVWKISPNGDKEMIFDIDARDGTFHLVNSSVRLGKGDTIRSTCTMHNDLNTTIKIEEHEMCIIVMVYISDDDHLLTTTKSFHMPPGYKSNREFLSHTDYADETRFFIEDE